MSGHSSNYWRLLYLSCLVLTGPLDWPVATASVSHRLDHQTRLAIYEVLASGLADPSPTIQAQSADILVGLDYRTAVEAYIKATSVSNDPDTAIARTFARARLAAHDKTFRRSLEQELQDRLRDPKDISPLLIWCLARLDSVLSGDEIQQVENWVATHPEAAVDGWSLLHRAQPDRSRQKDLVSLLQSDSVSVRQAAIEVLGNLKDMSPSTRLALMSRMRDPSSLVTPVTLQSILQRAHPEETGRTLAGTDSNAFRGALSSGSDQARRAAYLWHADFGTIGNTLIRQLSRAAKDEQAPLSMRLVASQALLRMGRRAPTRLALLDWLVIGLYGAGMLGVGWYYARRAKSADDYFVGGRSMNSLMVGLSLFATLLSTLSYLAYPGEMIKYGPLVLLGGLSYPLIFLVVGWFLIPRFMQLRVTSAYEILETQLGVSVRMLGTFFFLSLRLLWMGSIVYWTTAIVLIPASGLDDSYTTWVAAILGIVTLVYTSLGGLRAVVLTDVVQTAILFLGAIVALVLITTSLGGVRNWLPTEWPAHWLEFRIWFDFNPETRATLANACLGTFLWYVCTAGSDQMAVQRYLATRDVTAARKTLATSLITDVVVLVFLAMLGLALLAYFSANPYLIDDRTSLYDNADKLFPRFVIVGLPTGFSGLVVAGLLAAAMSSLSSGINSSSAVVTVDLVDRWNRKPADHSATAESKRVRRARIVTVALGILVILISFMVGNLKGNMLENLYKVVNLFTAPLFYLFLMALFVPWANSGGTLLGAAAAVGSAAAVAFWEDATGTKGISFLWILPISLTSGTLIGCIVSFMISSIAGSRIKGDPPD